MQIFRWCDGSYLEDPGFLASVGHRPGRLPVCAAGTAVRDVRIVADLDASYRNGLLAVEVAGRQRSRRQREDGAQR